MKYIVTEVHYRDRVSSLRSFLVGKEIHIKKSENLQKSTFKFLKAICKNKSIIMGAFPYSFEFKRG